MIRTTEHNQVATTKVKEPDPPSEPWTALLKDFTQNTTFHGIRYMTLDSRFVIRKVLWLLLLLSALVVFVFYMVERVEEFLKYKKNVSVEENYVDHMVFPAITVCNQNPFRITVAAEGGWYPIAKRLTSVEGQKLDLRDCFHDEFMCGTKDCIPQTRWCDSFPDCADGTDEVGCEKCHRMVVSSDTASLNIPRVTGGTFDLLENTYKVIRQVYIRKDLAVPIFLYLDKHKGQWLFSDKVEGGDILAWAGQNVTTPQSITVDWTEAASSKSGSLTFVCTNVTFDSPFASGLPSDKLNLETLYKSGATPMNDFRQSCSWKGNDCPTNAFRERLTDMGVCYTFRTDNMNVERSGPGFALSLTLNIEQFEYTKDPQTGVGIRVLLHDPDDEPLMQGRAFAISPGLNTMVAIEKTMVQNLEKPWGNCSTKPLKYFDTYSVFTCQMDCENTFAREQCGCLDINMPSKGTSDFPTCTAEQYVTCLYPKLVAVRKKVDFCTCPTPCSETVYVSSLSFAAISTDDDILKSRQREEKFSNMQKQLAAAREISYRVLDDKYRSTLRMFHTVELKVSTMLWMLHGLNTQLVDQLSNVTEIGQLVKADCLWFSRSLYSLSNQLKSELLYEINSYTNYFIHQVVTSFTQFKDIVEVMDRGYTKDERNFLNTRTGKIKFTEYDTNIYLSQPEFKAENVSLKTQKFMTLTTEAELYTYWNNTPLTLMDNVTLEVKEGTAFYSDLKVSARSGRMKGAQAEVWLSDEDFWKHTSQNWLQFATLRTAYHNALTIIRKVNGGLKAKLRSKVLDLKDTDYRLIHNRANQLLDGSRVTCNWCIKSNEALFTILRSRLLTFMDNDLDVTLEELEAGLNNTYNLVLRGWVVNTSVLKLLLKDSLPSLVQKTEQVAEQLHKEMHQDTTLASHVLDEMLRPLAPMCESEMPKKIAEYQDAHLRITNSIKEMREKLAKYHKDLITYKDNYLTRNLTLAQVADYSGYQQLSADIRVGTTTTSNALRDAGQIVKRITEHINMVYFWFMAQANDSFLVKTRYWRHFDMKEADVILPKDGKEAMLPNQAVRDFWTSAKESLLLMVDNLSAHIRDLSGTLTEADVYVKSFVDGNSIGEQFFKKNFLQMDIFYKALTDKKVTQQKAYEYPALLSELGGLLGLLLGASSITVIEVLDLFLYNCCVKCKEYRERRRNQRRGAVTRTNHRLAGADDDDVHVMTRHKHQVDDPYRHSNHAQLPHHT